MNLSHLRVALIGREGFWWFRPECIRVLEEAIQKNAEWVVLVDTSGVHNHLRLSEIVGFYVWTPEMYDAEKAVERAVREHCGEIEEDNDGEQWKRR
jgi:hypothetical protein